ncbi:helix-turn-helix domain-containing protein, partial [Chloroflexota bacterium]
KACSKDALAAAWGEEFATDEQIEQCIHRIRQRVEPDPRNPSLIITIRGYGYKLTLPTQG